MISLRLFETLFLTIGDCVCVCVRVTYKGIKHYAAAHQKRGAHTDEFLLLYVILWIEVE